MAKGPKKYELPQSDYLKAKAKRGTSFVLVAIPLDILTDIDVVRDAIVTYLPGYDEGDFVLLRSSLEWIDHIEELVCKKSGA